MCLQFLHKYQKKMPRITEFVQNFVESTIQFSSADVAECYVHSKLQIYNSRQRNMYPFRGARAGVPNRFLSERVVDERPVSIPRRFGCDLAGAAVSSGLRGGGAGSSLLERWSVSVSVRLEGLINLAA